MGDRVAVADGVCQNCADWLYGRCPVCKKSAQGNTVASKRRDEELKEHWREIDRKMIKKGLDPKKDDATYFAFYNAFG